MELIPGLPDDMARECLVRVSYHDFFKFLEICKGWKTEINSPQYLQQRKATGLSRTLVVLSQADRPVSSSGSGKHRPTPAYHLSLYDPEAGSWSRLPAIPGYPDGLPLFCQCAGVGRYLLVIGGWNPTTWKASRSVYVFDFVSTKWKCGADMPGPCRSFFGCVSDTNRMVFVAGGHDEEKNSLRSVLAYDVIEDKWVSLSDMAKQRDECKAVFHGGKLHVIGGYCTAMQGKFEKNAELFDVATCKWYHVEADLLHAEMCPRNSVVVDENGKMFMCYAGNLAVLDGSACLAVPELPTDVRGGSFVLSWQKKMLVIGSQKVDGTNNTELIDGEKGYMWTKMETPAEFTGHVQVGCSIKI